MYNVSYDNADSDSYLNPLLTVLLVAWYDGQSVHKVICRVEVHRTGVTEPAKMNYNN